MPGAVVPRRNGEAAGVRLALHHDLYDLATAVPGLFSLLPSSSREPTGVARPFIHLPSSGRSDRMNVDPCAARLRFDHFELDEAEARLTRAGQPMPLAPKPFAVLCALARAPRMLVDEERACSTPYGAIGSSPSRCSSPRSAKCAQRSATTRRRRATSRRSRAAAIASSPLRPVRPRRARLPPPASARRPATPALAALTALCRGDAALGDLIRAVAATLERERLVLNDS